MQCFILLGSSEAREHYLASFITAHTIRQYNILTFEMKIKLAEAHSIRKFFSIQAGKGEAKLVVISDATIDSQNSLLKTIEELPESDFIIWSRSNHENLLETIKSRASTIVLSSEESVSPRHDQDLLQLLVNATSDKKTYEYTALKIAEKASLSQDTIDDLLQSLRSLILENVVNGGIGREKLTWYFQVLSRLQEMYSYIGSNNLNKRFVIENILFSLRDYNNS